MPPPSRLHSQPSATPSMQACASAWKLELPGPSWALSQRSRSESSARPATWPAMEEISSWKLACDMRGLENVRLAATDGMKYLACQRKIAIRRSGVKQYNAY